MPFRKLRLLIPLIALFSFVSFAPADEPALDDFDKALDELYTSGKLFKKEEYKTVRAAFARRFEIKHADTLQQAFGEDHEKLTAWLKENPEIKEELFTAIDEVHDDVVAVLRLFRDIWKKHPDTIKPYFNLAIAVAVVWDDPKKGVYDHTHHGRRTKSIIPDNKDVGAMENYEFLVKHEKVMQGRGQFSPWEMLVYVVDHSTPLTEREWALANYLGRRGMFGKCYSDVQYDKGMLAGKTPRLADKPYTLLSILQNGGVCAMQADFAARVGKSMGVPAAYVRGEGKFAGAGHAWVMWVELKQVAKEKVLFTLESHGRYQIDEYYTGDVEDPQTGQKILDRDMELRLAIAGFDRQAKRQAELIMQAFPLLRARKELDTAAQLKYLDNCQAICAYNEESWLSVAQLAKEGAIKKADTALAYRDRLFKTFNNYPDFIWKVFDDLTSAQTDPAERVKLFERFIGNCERAGRADLACKARLRAAELLAEQKKWKDAALGLVNTILKFPAEGRYIPDLMTKLEEVCKEFKEGNDNLARFYVAVLPRIPTKRGDAISEHCVTMYTKAIAFYKSIKQDRVAAGLDVELQRIKTTGRR